MQTFHFMLSFSGGDTLEQNECEWRKQFIGIKNIRNCVALKKIPYAVLVFSIPLCSLTPTQYL